MTVGLYDNIVLLAIASTLVPATVFLWQFKHQPNYNSLIFCLLIVSLISDLSSWILSQNGLSSIFIVNAYSIIAFVLLNLFYHQILFIKRARIVQYITGAIFLISMVWFGTETGFSKPSNYTWAISSAGFALYSFLYFYFIPLMIVERYLDLHLFSNVVLNISLCLYFVTSIILFFFMDFVFANQTIEEARAFWSIHNIINILKNFGIALAFFLSGKRKPYISLTQLEKMKSE
jgi:hypothetical protein